MGEKHAERNKFSTVETIETPETQASEKVSWGVYNCIF